MAIDQVSENANLTTNLPFTIKHVIRNQLSNASRRSVGSEYSEVSVILQNVGQLF